MQIYSIRICTSCYVEPAAGAERVVCTVEVSPCGGGWRFTGGAPDEPHADSRASGFPI